MRIPSPFEIKNEFQLQCDSLAFINDSRAAAKQILNRKDPRLVLLVGPCSIHDPDMALEYGDRLKRLSAEIENFFIIMRLFLEKPRTRTGWKGIVYDPFLDKSNDIISGIKISRKLLLELTRQNIPTAAELLEPLIVPYFSDLFTWGLIGARTSASQPHRQMASGLPFPVGFKNDIHGELDVAISGILSSRIAHSYINIDESGRIASVRTRGNPLTHLVLRGSKSRSNYDSHSIDLALNDLQTNHLEPCLLIDCSHGNSGKDYQRQRMAFESVIQQICEGNHAIAGLMLESNIFSGNQVLGDDPSLLRYGVSITDSCMSWEETESLIRSADEKLSLRSISMSSVQK